MTSEDHRDTVTARLLSSGDPEGLRRLLADHGGTVRWTLTREFSKVLDQLQIDDALSQASQRVWKSGHRFDPARGTLRAWFYVIARNCARRLLERQRSDATFRQVDDLDAHARRPSDAAVPTPPSPFVQDLRRCIDQLPRLQRAVVLADLAAGGSAPAAELAAELGTSANSVYVSRTNARKALKAALGRLGLQQDPPGAAPAAEAGR